MTQAAFGPGADVRMVGGVVKLVMVMWTSLALDTGVVNAYTARAVQYPPPRATPIMGWNAWNTFSINGKPLRGGRAE